jgi:hypothetical protein
VSGNQAHPFHQALYLTQLPELRIALGADRSCFPAVDRLRRSTTLPPLWRSRPCRGPSMGPADLLTSYGCLAAL